MSMKTWQACVLSAGAAATALLLVTGDRNATAQVGAAPDARWHVAVIERSGFEDPTRIMRDAVLVDAATGQTWMMTNNRGLEPAWVLLPQRAPRGQD